MMESCDGTWRILLVTPDNQLRLWAASYLRSAGFMVADVRGAAEALHLSDRCVFNLAFAEVKIPTSRQGFNLAWHINRCRPGTTIFLCPDGQCLIEQVCNWVSAVDTSQSLPYANLLEGDDYGRA
jgi:DNA-binding NtrC family response regulator